MKCLSLSFNTKKLHTPITRKHEINLTRENELRSK